MTLGQCVDCNKRQTCAATPLLCHDMINSLAFLYHSKHPYGNAHHPQPVHNGINTHLKTSHSVSHRGSFVIEQQGSGLDALPIFAVHLIGILESGMEGPSCDRLLRVKTLDE